MKFCVHYLTCGNEEEAEKIIDVLLGKKMIVCAKHENVKTKNLWKGEIENGEEVRIIMESVEENFERIEEEVGKIHSYETFVLYSVPMGRINKKAEEWMEEELGS
jgi:periplasmic divalent cation tolerance protein